MTKEKQEARYAILKKWMADGRVLEENACAFINLAHEAQGATFTSVEDYYNSPDYSEMVKDGTLADLFKAYVKGTFNRAPKPEVTERKRTDILEIEPDRIKEPEARESRIEAVSQPRSQGNDALVDVLIRTLLPHIQASAGVKHEDVVAIMDKHLGNGGFPKDQVNELVKEAMRGLVMRIEVKQPSGNVIEMGRQHYKFPLLLKCMEAKLNVALVGGAGGGKTSAAHNAAKATERDFGALSVGPMTSKADLFGFKDAGGEYHETQLVRLARDGGVWLGDEFDAANAGVATYTNMLTANEHFATPIGMMKKSDNFICIIGMNTYGMGANRVYVGRNQLDGATLDRYVMIDWGYDRGLTAHMVGVARKSPELILDEGGIMETEEWMEYVWTVEEACERLALRHVVSPRATLHGVKLFAAGVGRTHVEEMVIFKGMEAATKQKIIGAIS